MFFATAIKRTRAMSCDCTNPGTNNCPTANSNDCGRTGFIHQRKTKQITIACKCITGTAPDLGRFIITRRPKQPTVFNMRILVICRHTHQTFGRCRIPTRIVPTLGICQSIIINLNPHWMRFNQNISILIVVCTNRLIIFCSHTTTVGHSIKRSPICISIQQQTCIFRLVRGQSCFPQNKVIIRRLYLARIKVNPNICRRTIYIFAIFSNLGYTAFNLDTAQPHSIHN